jgi:multidrug efflux pump subunit AcrB
MSITMACSASGSISVVLAPVRFSTFLQPENSDHYETIFLTGHWGQHLERKLKGIQETLSTP